jgi:transcriptional regulator with XRE-family HTH domain
MDGLYKQFGTQLRDLRKAAGLTQDQVAERVELKRTSITNIERGRQHIALHQLYLLANAVGKAPSDLLPETEPVLQELLPKKGVAALRASAEDDQDLAFAAQVISKAKTENGKPAK